MISTRFWFLNHSYVSLKYELFLLAILKNADLEKTSSKKVRLTLETKFGCDFTNRRKEIDGMVMDYVDSMQNVDSEQSSSEEEQVQKKESPKKVAKKRKANSDSDASDNNDSGDDYKPKKPAPRAAKKTKKADTGKKKEKGTGRKGLSNHHTLNITTYQSIRQMFDM